MRRIKAKKIRIVTRRNDIYDDSETPRDTFTQTHSDDLPKRRLLLTSASMGATFDRRRGSRDGGVISFLSLATLFQYSCLPLGLQLVLR